MINSIGVRLFIGFIIWIRLNLTAKYFWGNLRETQKSLQAIN